RPPRSALFPYTTLFRSARVPRGGLDADVRGHSADDQRADAEAVEDRLQAGAVEGAGPGLVDDQFALGRGQLVDDLRVPGARRERDRKSTRLNSSHVKTS